MLYLYRWPVIIALAGVLSWVLFVTIHVMIAQEQHRRLPAADPFTIEFLPVARDERIQTRTRLPARPPKNRPLPPPPPKPAAPPPTRASDWSPSQALSLAPAEFGLAMPLDGAALARHRVLPQYPRHARARGLEGWVLLEFDIATTGRPENLRVVDSEPPGIFEASALRAVRQWLYHPRAHRGVRQLIRFDITQ